jgi:hypothetical protein
MAARLHSGAENGEHAGIRARHVLCGDGRDRGRAHFGDQAAIHQRHKRAGFGIEQQNAGAVGGQAARLVGPDYGHQLGAQHGRVAHESGHDGEEGALSHLHDWAHRLHYLTGGECGQRGFHRAHQVGHGQHRADVGFAEAERHRWQCSV